MPLLRLCRIGEINLCLSLANMSCQIWKQSWSKPRTNFSRQDEPWAEFSTLEVAACHAMHLPHIMAMWPNLRVENSAQPCLSSKCKTRFKVLPTNALAYLTSSESDRKKFRPLAPGVGRGQQWFVGDLPFVFALNIDKIINVNIFVMEQHVFLHFCWL